MNTVLREEKKFLISVKEFMAKSHELEKIMISDEHNTAQGYTVRSLYFDTPFDEDFFEKSDGVEVRRKIRLRIYDPKNDFAMLELKQKQGSNQQKRSLRLSREDSERLIQGDYGVLLNYKDDFAKEMYGLMLYKCYRPKTIVEYNRKAFIAKENKIRVTFDSHVVSTESSFDLFSSQLNMSPVMDSYDVIMEVKFNGFLLSYIKEMINSIDKSELSVSKYCLARHNAYCTHI